MSSKVVRVYKTVDLTDTPKVKGGHARTQISRLALCVILGTWLCTRRNLPDHSAQTCLILFNDYMWFPFMIMP